MIFGASHQGVGAGGGRGGGGGGGQGCLLLQFPPITSL